MIEPVAHLRKAVERGDFGYHSDGPPAAEPAALAGLALCAGGLPTESLSPARWLAKLQTPHGSVGVMQQQDTPAWPTSLAILAWLAHDRGSRTSTFDEPRQRAIGWALDAQGKSAPQQDHIGHNTTLVGWSWAADTHSWLEPTCLFVLALKAVGLTDHPRTREGVRLIIDRQLETGGCNFGNTQVLGQATVPHIQPTGLAMLALANELITDARIERSLEYLENSLSESTATASLCFALIGLTAHTRRPANAEQLLAKAFQRDSMHNTTSCYKLALLSLASRPDVRWAFQDTSIKNTAIPRPTARQLA